MFWNIPRFQYSTFYKYFFIFFKNYSASDLKRKCYRDLVIGGVAFWPCISFISIGFSLSYFNGCIWLREYIAIQKNNISEHFRECMFYMVWYFMSTWKTFDKIYLVFFGLMEVWIVLEYKQILNIKWYMKIGYSVSSGQPEIIYTQATWNGISKLYLYIYT